MEGEHVFKAVADHHRRRLLDSLSREDGQTLTRLCARMPMSRIGVMKHLDILEQAGLITTRKVGREKFHYLNPEPLHNVDDWLAAYRRRWNDRMDRLEDLINRSQRSDQAGTLAESQPNEQKKEQKDAEA